MISVFRIYLGQAWLANGKAAELRALFDALPEFLHRVLVLTPEGRALAEAAATPAAREAAVRVAMTQAHVAILWGGEALSDDAWTPHELAIANRGFRRRIPVLAVTPPGVEAAATAAVEAADRIEGWDSTAIACAVQELTESAVSERRQMLRRIVAEVRPAPLLAPRESESGPRTLPIAKIAEAYAELRASRASVPRAKRSS